MITDLEELKKLAEAATPGPWGFRQYPGDDAEIYPTYEAPPSFGEWAALFIAKDTYEDEIPDRAVANASFIAAARSALPALIERVEAAEAEVKLLREENGSLIDENSDLRCEPWPEWASAVLKVIRAHSGYDGYDDATDGVDLPAELGECFSELEGVAEAQKVRAEAAEAENARLMSVLGRAGIQLSFWKATADKVPPEHNAMPFIEPSSSVIDEIDAALGRQS